MQQTEQELKENFKDIFELFQEKGCKLTYFKKKTEKLKFICSCGMEKERLYKDFMRGKDCRTCKEKKLKEKPDDKEYTDEKTGEIWKPIVGGWISSFGNAKNSLGKMLTLCPTKFRYHINGTNQYASSLVANAFEIEDHEHLIHAFYIITHLDKNQANNNVNNLKVTTKSNVGSVNGQKSRQSESFKEKINWTQNRFKDIENKKIHELPKHLIYKNGEIWNGNRFLTFSVKDNYSSICILEKNYKVHRLVCYAFNPIDGKTKLSDYDELQVNHKDGNKFNNNSDNLEWNTSSENMFHSYENNLNRKVRNVLQYTLDGDFMEEYISIAEASRKSGEPEHRIRTISQGKTNSEAIYIWKFKNEAESEEYSKKYDKK